MLNSHVAFCDKQKSVVIDNKVANELPFSPKGGLDEKTLVELRRYCVILIDTCQLMAPGFDIFLRKNVIALRANGIKFCVTAQVMMELFSNRRNGDDEKSFRASRGWALLDSPEFCDIFDKYPPNSTDMYADSSLVEFARSLKVRHGKNVLILTQDKRLTCAIFNVCDLKDRDEKNGVVQVLFVDSETAKFTRYHESRLENLAPGVVLPDWNVIGAPKFKSWKERYFYDSIHGGEVFMDSCALRHALGVMVEKKNFCALLDTLGALRHGQKINVVTTSLRDPEIRRGVESMPNLFYVVEVPRFSMTEEEAIFQAMLDVARDSVQSHMLLITNKKERFDYIQARIPTSHKMQEFRGCFINKHGFLCNSAQDNDVVPLAA